MKVTLKKSIDGTFTCLSFVENCEKINGRLRVLIIKYCLAVSTDNIELIDLSPYE
jgi:hypothetical protein